MEWAAGDEIVISADEAAVLGRVKELGVTVAFMPKGIFVRHDH